MTHTFKTILLSAAATTALASSAMAGGFSIREQSAEGQGASFAGIAAGSNGLSSMFWNPATMSLHNGQGFVSESNVAIIAPFSKATDGRLAGPAPLVPFNNSGNIGELAFVPSSYWVYGVNEDLTIGASMNSPFGLVTDAKDNWAGVTHGDRSDVKTYTFTPQASYRLNDMISVGLGAQLEYMTVGLSSRTPSTGVRIAEVNADSLGLGFTAGVLFQPTDTTNIGLGFRSSIKHNLKGKSRLGPDPGLSGRATANYNSPETVTLGVRQKMTDDLTLLAGVEWANWSRFKALNIAINPPGIVSSTPENWKDSWFYSLGAEYAASDVLMLRGGVAFEKSPVPDATRTPRTPDNDRFWVSAGATYKLSDTMTANIAYSHVFMKNGGINLAPNPPTAPAPLIATFKQHLDIVSAGLTIDW
jgi:long-chain fatty acid transport protein